MANYKTVCPECGNNNYGIAEEKGFGYCFNCNYTQRLDGTYKPRNLTRSKRIPEIRAFYKELAALYHSNLSREHRLFLYSRGISDKSINDLQLGYCSPDMLLQYKSSIATEAGIAWSDKGVVTLAGRITFPFQVEGQITDLWGRSLDPNEEIRYKGPFGGAWKRGSDYTYMHDKAYVNSDYLVRTEGLIKAVVSNQYGIPCVANPGTTANRTGTPPMQGQKQIIIYDNQINHRRELLAAIRKEAERYIDPYIGTLPLRGRKKIDIDSLILEDGIEEYRRIVNGALPYRRWLELIR